MSMKFKLFAGHRGLISMLIMGVFLLQGCMDPSVGDDGEETSEVIESIPVEAAVAITRDMAAYYSGTATLEADRQAVVVSQITGVVLEIGAEEGDYVEAGQVLAMVETDRYALEVQRSNATLKRLETDFQRKKELFGKKLVSTEDYERVAAEFESQKAAHELAKLDLEYTRIRAPISGFISERTVRVGNLVTLHQPVYQITSYDPLLAVLHVPERELRVLSNGLEVTVLLDAWPGEQFIGEVIRISPVVDPSTGTFRVTAEIHDREQMLKPGLFGRVDILYDLRENVPVIPRSAVITEDETSHVFVIGDDGSVMRRNIELGYENQGQVEVLSGLIDGETVVTAGKGSLSDGTRVEIVGDDPVVGV